MLGNYEALVMLAIIIAGSWLINRPLNAFVPHAACRMPRQLVGVASTAGGVEQSLHLFLFSRSCRRMDQFLIYL